MPTVCRRGPTFTLACRTTTRSSVATSATVRFWGGSHWSGGVRLWPCASHLVGYGHGLSVWEPPSHAARCLLFVIAAFPSLLLTPPPVSHCFRSVVWLPLPQATPFRYKRAGWQRPRHGWRGRGTRPGAAALASTQPPARRQREVARRSPRRTPPHPYLGGRRRWLAEGGRGAAEGGGGCRAGDGEGNGDWRRG